MENDDLFFPKGFCDIGEISFKDLYDRKKEWVDFTLTEMKSPKGMFKTWQDYCKKRAQLLKDEQRRH